MEDIVLEDVHVKGRKMLGAATGDEAVSSHLQGSYTGEVVMETGRSGGLSGTKVMLAHGKMRIGNEGDRSYSRAG